MPRTMQQSAPATAPQMGFRSVAGEQLEMVLSDGKTYAERIEDAVSALILGVEKMGGIVAFAALLERPTPEVSRRVNRADDGKGTRMEPFLSYVAFLDDAAFTAFHDALGAARGKLPAENVRKLSPDERASHLASLITDEVKRAAEKKRGLPAGSLG